MGAGHDHALERRADTGAPGVVARLDPRARLLSALGPLLALSLVHRPGALATAVVLALALAFVARIDLAAVRTRLLHVEGFLVALLVVLPLTVPGTPIATPGPFTVSAEGLARAAEVAVKVNVAALVLLALVGGLEPARLGPALAGLGLPDRLVHLFVLTARYVALVGAESDRLREAMRARGFVASAGRHGLRSLGHLAGRLLTRAFERAERIDEAMRLRGFQGRYRLAEAPSLGPADRAALALAFAATLAVLAVERLA